MSDLVRQHREGIGPHARRQDVRQKRAERATRVVTGDQAITKVSVIGGTPGASGAPTDADYLVGTANASLSAEIVVGTTPGGQLGGTWPSPDVRGLRTTTGPSLLSILGIADGELLKRSGLNVQGQAVGSGGGLDADLLDGSHLTDIVLKSLFDAYTILMATADNTPIALEVPAQTLVGRITGGAIAALTAAQVKTLLALTDAATRNINLMTSDAAAASTTVPKYVFIVPVACTITDIELILGGNQTCGATSLIVDIHKIPAANKGTDGQGTTIYTTQANRPTITNTNRYVLATDPDVTAIAAGDALALYIDVAGTGVTIVTAAIKVTTT